jgi:hypothetical protein
MTVDKQNELPKRDDPTCIRGGHGQALKALQGAFPVPALVGALAARISYW